MGKHKDEQDAWGRPTGEAGNDTPAQSQSIPGPTADNPNEDNDGNTGKIQPGSSGEGTGGGAVPAPAPATPGSTPAPSDGGNAAANPGGTNGSPAGTTGGAATAGPSQ